jgi:hypothetical protein
MKARRQEDEKSVQSWGNRPRPKGLGTKHKHFDVPNSGYMKEAINSETHTRNEFYDNKYRLVRPPNTVFGETHAEAQGKYLVEIPADHECYTIDPATGLKTSGLNSSSGSTLRNRIDALVTTVLHNCTAGSTLVHAKALQARIDKDNLQAKRDLVFQQLREAEVAINPNFRKREEGLVDPDPLPPDLILPNRGLNTTLRAYPSQRSKPKFTLRIPGPGFP